MRDRAVILLSGGADSTTLLAVALADDVDPVALSVDYGQKHVAELDAARAVAGHYDVPHLIVTLPPTVFQGAGSALIDGPMPQVTYEELEAAEGVSPTYVPFRNANLISQAVAVALTIDAGYVYAAPHAEDARGWAYPDCTPEFNGAMGAAVYVGTYHKVRLRTPFQWMTKAEIVRVGLDLGVPFHLTLSCYEGSVPPCGTCPTCLARHAAFERAGAPDPLEHPTLA
jgi:7-cyano-7-deazaguanine synthase